MLKKRFMQVISRAKKMWQEDASKAALVGRISFAPGDFFKPGQLLTYITRAQALVDSVCHEACLFRNSNILCSCLAPRATSDCILEDGSH